MLDWGVACSAQAWELLKFKIGLYTCTLRRGSQYIKIWRSLKSSTEVQQFKVLATAGNQGDTADQGLQGGGLVALGQELPGD